MTGVESRNEKRHGDRLVEAHVVDGVVHTAPLLFGFGG
jgi:hypothetical protein